MMPAINPRGVMVLDRQHKHVTETLCHSVSIRCKRLILTLPA